MARTTGSSPAQGALAIAGSDHRAIYRHIRNYLAGQAVGATRDRSLLDELVKALFCKHLLDHEGRAPEPTASGADVGAAYSSALATIGKRYPQAFGDHPTFELDTPTLAFVHGAISSLDLDSPDGDLIGDAYEVFTGSDARGQEGQFFTPQNAVDLLVSLIDLQPGERIIDPACGAGGFLSGATRDLIGKGVEPTEAVAAVWGIDKDRYLARLAWTRLAFLGLTQPNVECADSLGWRDDEGAIPAAQGLEGSFDVVLTNPPFGSKIVAATSDTQRGFDLGHQWKLKDGVFVRTPKLARNAPPQVLFVERCLSLVREGGRIGIVLPESLISGRNYRHVVSWIRARAKVQAVVGMPEALFKTSGKGGTHTKTCLVLLEKRKRQAPGRHKIFMAEARWCGNDSRGRKTGRDELPTIAERWRNHVKGKLVHGDHLGYAVDDRDIVDDILAPRYYNPDVAEELAMLEETHELVRFGDLVEQGVLSISTGHEVGAAEYGTGAIPFVRTSDISNWEIKVDPKHGVSEEVFESFATKQDVQEGDILMVRDGTYLIGTCAYVTKYDTRIVFQSHLFKIRVIDRDRISPYLLLAALSSAPVRRQVLAKRFTQDIIDSLGNRVHELVLPLPKDRALRDRVEDMVRRSINERVEARELARQAVFELIGRVATRTGDLDDPDLGVQ
jgi:type I restriction enzyme M protein